ncbi:MAG: hypothetical protein ACJAVV_001965 [Alphaproteobacteria bacterium]|jgi:hypothetical protein
MTDHNKSPEHDALENEAIDALYRKRKARYMSPNSIKQDVLNTLETNEPNVAPWWRINLRPYAQVSAVTCTIAVAFIVISLQVMNKDPDPLLMQASTLNSYQTVEIHELAPISDQLAKTSRARSLYEESLSSDSLSSPAKTQERQIQYQRAQSVYLARQADLAVHQQSYATVVQSEDGLSLLTCDEHLLKLSQDVVDMLLSRQSNKKIDFSKGQMLALAFDSKGHIINISQGKNRTEC